MADAESNLVPSEAAATRSRSRSRSRPRPMTASCTSTSTSTKTTWSPTLRAWSPRPGAVAPYVAAAIAALIGIGMLAGGGNWIKFGVVLIVFGAFLAWWSKSLHHTLARDFIDAVEADESMGGRYRRVAANEDGLMVWARAASRSSSRSRSSTTCSTASASLWPCSPTRA